MKWLVGLVSSNSSRVKGSANGSSSGGSDFMQEFFAKVETVKSNISLIKDATKDIADINQNVLQATTNEREQDYSNKLGTDCLYQRLLIHLTGYFVFNNQSRLLRKPMPVRHLQRKLYNFYVKRQIGWRLIFLAVEYAFIGSNFLLEYVGVAGYEINPWSAYTG